MATLAEVKALADSLQVSLDAEQQQVADLLAQKDNTIATLNQTIIDLQAIIDSGGDPVALQAIADGLTALKTDLEATVAP
jgi:hypothetical protein